MKLWAILPALILAGALRAQTPAAKPGSVDGVVTNSTTGEPVKKALVMLQGTTAAGAMGKTSSTATTDASGHFHFGNVQPGSYSVSWERDGFMPPGSGSGRSFPRVTVSEEQDVQDVAIKLVPMGAVSGHVLDEDGEPILRAQVAVLRYFYGSGRKQLSQVAFAQSNDLGEFEAINLQPGRYYFQAEAPPPRNIPPHTRWTRPEEAYPSTFYPNAREASQASGSDVAPGAHVSHIDFRLHKMPAYHIRGTVLGESGGQPGAGGEVMVVADSKFLENMAQSGLQTDGSFDVRGVVNGAYRLSYMRFSQGQPSPSYSSQPVRVSDGDVNAVVLTRRPELEVSGTVTVEGPQPEKLGLVVALSTVQGMGEAGSSEVGADGRIVMTNVPAEVYELQLYNVPPGKYVKSIRFGDREIKGGEIDLTAGLERVAEHPARRGWRRGGWKRSDRGWAARSPNARHSRAGGRIQ